MLTLESKLVNYKISIPQHLSEIPEDYFENVAKNINLPKHYAIIALARKVRFYDFVMTINNSKVTGRSTDIAILAKINSDSYPDSWKIGQHIIIDESDLVRGTQINLPSILTYSNIADFLVTDENLSKKNEPGTRNTLIGNILGGIAKDENGNLLKDYPIYFFSFKIIPVSAIHGTVERENSFKDPFIIIDNKK